MHTNMFLAFANCISDPLVLVGDDGLILSYNEATNLDFALKVDVIGEDVSQLFDCDDGQLRNFLHSCVSTEEPYVSPHQFRGSNNRLYSLEGRLMAGTRLTVMRCFLHQVTTSPLTVKLADEIKRRESIERQLISSQAHARAILETAADAIITIDEQGKLLSFNAAAERIFGYRAEEVIGENVGLLMPEEEGERYGNYLQYYRHSNKSSILSSRREMMGKRKSGELFHIDIGVSEVVVDNQRTFTGIIRDIHRRIVAEEQVKAQQEEHRLQRERLVHVSRLSTLGELAAGIAHEINQPLTAISNYAKVTERTLQRAAGEIEAGIPCDASKFSTIVEANQKISEQAMRAGGVIQRLRNLIKREASTSDHIDINVLVKETMVLAETDTKVNNYELAFEPNNESIYVLADSIQLQQVILNFVRNAIDAMNDMSRKHGCIILRTSQTDKAMAKVSVIDQGSGISDDRASQLFDPFFTTKSNGLGLGLSISHNIIQSYGGRIGYENNEEKYNAPPNSVGATLYFTLPIAEKKS